MPIVCVAVGVRRRTTGDCADRCEWRVTDMVTECVSALSEVSLRSQTDLSRVGGH